MRVMSTVMTWQTYCQGPAETEALGKALGRLLKTGDVVELTADLGGGKTTFIRGLAGGAGSQDVVSSPSFTLGNIYKTKKFDIHHYDFYRLSDPGVLANQLAESLSDPKTITVVEWGRVVDRVLPGERIVIELKPDLSDSEKRQIIFNYPDSKTSMLKQLQASRTGVKE
ncbi:tRNA (adenosine(37)-N6)-threonylcarbamoyltransferase complex ATPase subunit type 1 TsaE [Candidatus Saccharibacteria bacterium RIFCSPLOWO2_01_FULL_48_13]|nr:MAG: tRNA (adenosine(37)-N6)-threonylcarbamoyltransferase complex ATPase subunit type 1 TsaE [Candidatus Saccharibacteria bacterium RIFCSPHIGHO2_01_FULL_48_12]OGL36756.1 MAG: tRNA (adenosine(37)-N6)-threonylcarbamoyltransferase complex ATPase subunit type 1 TsaE [Candidatus Saccharibacteria bacterium RIFCSPLOWO2_01_FULL_48_13]